MKKISCFPAFLISFFQKADRKKLLLPALILLLLSGVAIRIIAINYMPDHFLHNDGEDYLDISEQIAKGNGFSKTKFLWYEAAPPDYNNEPHTAFHRPPLLPLLGAVFYFLPPDPLFWAKISVFIVSMFCSLMVFFLAKEIFDDLLTAFLAAFLYTFYPYSIFHSLYYSSENLFLFFICAAYYFAVKWQKNAFRLPYAALAGGMMALATLTRPQGFGLFLLLGFIGTVIMLFRKEIRKKMFISLVVYTLGAFLLLSPWMIRNYICGGVPTPLTFYGPYTFAQASSDVSYVSYKYIDTPQYKEMTDQTWNSFHAEKRKFLAEKKIYTLTEANPYWKKWAWEYIKSNPEKMWFIIKSKILHCFRLVPNKASMPPAVLMLLYFYFVPFLFLFLAGIWFARKNLSALFLLSAPLYVVLSAIPFLMIFRFRYPFFAPAAAIFAAYGLYKVCCNIPFLQKYLSVNKQEIN